MVDRLRDLAAHHRLKRPGIEPFGGDPWEEKLLRVPEAVEASGE